MASVTIMRYGRKRTEAPNAFAFAFAFALIYNYREDDVRGWRPQCIAARLKASSASKQTVSASGLDKQTMSFEQNTTHCVSRPE